MKKCCLTFIFSVLIGVIAAAEEIDLEEVLARAGKYVQGYQDDFSKVLAQEEYYQKTFSPGRGSESQRIWSDILLVRPDAGSSFKIFRDVYKVGRHAVRDRQDRLARLFVESPATLEKIAEESTRYNIGGLLRNFNLPTAALYFLESRIQSQFWFKKVGETTIDGVNTWEIRFIELFTPTLVRYNGHDIFTQGSFWIDPVKGRVLKTQLIVEQLGEKGMRAEITETYRFEPAIGLLVPTQMSEHYDFEAQKTFSGKIMFQCSIDGLATYSNFRKFSVSSKISFPENPVAGEAKPASPGTPKK